VEKTFAAANAADVFFLHNLLSANGKEGYRKSISLGQSQARSLQNRMQGHLSRTNFLNLNPLKEGEEI
jgi:hypothetical protein